MERTAYIFGAGFSAPMGVPVVRDFLMRAKDIYFANRTKYAHFADVLSAVRALDSVKNYLDADLFDIEEIFSIIEMQRQLGLSTPDFKQFIADVVKATTPELPPSSPGGRSASELWGRESHWADYGTFAMRLARLRLMGEGGRYACETEHEERRYDVITLNYDRILELALERLIQRSHPLTRAVYYRPHEKGPEPNCRLSIMKLHGDAYDGTIVPPTWDKSVRQHVEHDWRHAFQALSQANHVRILGYSFPATDTYFRYFLKAALARTEHLKTIDVVTLDPKEETRQRCAQIFSFKFLRFREYRSELYINHSNHTGDLEAAHEKLMVEGRII